MGSAVEIAPGLHRWTAWHEEWREDVGSVAVETAKGSCSSIRSLRLPSSATPEHVLLTVYWHGRAAAAAGAPRVGADAFRRPAPQPRDSGDRRFREGDDLPGGIRALQTPRAAEVVYWLPDHNALVVGDVLLGAGAKPNATTERLRLCPERWLGVATHDDLREALRPLLELPVESVLVSHGEPVLSGGGRALAAALD